MEDELYVITDVNGNYYRLDNEKQLVAAADRSDAELLSYPDAVERIGNGRKAHFYSIVPFAGNESNKGSKTTFLSYELDEIDWMEYLNHFLHVNTSMKAYEDELRQSLSDVDMEICDILHCVELRELTDSQSLDLMDQLRDCRERRRQVKDRMYEVEWFQKAFGYNDINSKVKESIKQINRLETRTYKPRKLMELFDGNLKVRKQRKRFIKEMEDEMEYQETEVVEVNQEEEEVYMTRERKETVFDDKQNNWLEFAKEQMLFFGNVRQYMVNLELDIERLDREIEEILIQIENATCNVTQGYKVFKSLKDLRVERREKGKEFQCLETLAGCFDCISMEESFRYSVGAITEIMTPTDRKREETIVEMPHAEEGMAG